MLSKTPLSSQFEGPTRYVPDARSRFARLRAAAEDYPDAIASGPGLGWMRRKPYDPTAGHPNFFNCLYTAMNAIQAMRLPPHALVVEVGSGPGWLTEILVGLGYRVIAIEPSRTMNEIAARRLEGFSATTGIECHNVRFLTATLEEAELQPFQQHADAVMFHEALHHVIDEHEAIRRVFDLLKPGGCMAICGEGRWNPGDRNLESNLDVEMEQYGTLESPFTQDYLRHILDEAGFADIAFHHSVNGLFEESQGNKSVLEIANPSALAANTVVAWRPLHAGLRNIPSVASAPSATSAEISVLRSEWQGDQLILQARIRNSGDTYWPVHRPPSSGGVTLALVQESVIVPPPEAANRCALPTLVLPGEELMIDWQFNARGLDRSACRVRLLAEDVFWFPGGAAVTGSKSPW
jgi:SAM-dependent methyltransferase